MHDFPAGFSLDDGKTLRFTARQTREVDDKVTFSKQIMRAIETGALRKTPVTATRRAAANATPFVQDKPEKGGE